MPKNQEKSWEENDLFIKQIAKDLRVHIKRNRITYEQLALLVYSAHTHAASPKGFAEWINIARRTNCGCQDVGPKYRGSMTNISRANKGESIL